MKKVLFYGDSNTYGYDPAGFMGGRYPRQQRWTGILAERLAGEWEIAADGMPGRMIPGNAYSIEIALDAVKADGPMDLFAVMLGTNDLLNQRHPYSPAVAARMQKLLGGRRICQWLQEGEHPPCTALQGAGGGQGNLLGGRVVVGSWIFL